MKKATEISSNNKKCGHNRIQCLVAAIVSMPMLLYGFDAGWTSPMTKILSSDQSPTGYPLSSSELSWVGSITALTAVVAVSLFAYTADAYGRKFSVLALGVTELISWALRLFATSTTTLIMSRAIGGLPAAGCFIILPMYVREISDDSTRGAMLSYVLAMQNFGVLFMYIMGSYMDYYVVLWISLSLTALSVVFMMFIPESPAYLVKRGKIEEAEKTVALLRGLDKDHKLVQLEVSTMRNEEEHYKSLPKITFMNIFQNKAWRRAFIYVTMVNTAQSGNGIFVILTYAWVILSSTGLALRADLQSLVVPTLMIFGSLVSIVSVQKLRRKLLLVSSFFLIAVAMAGLGTILLLLYIGYSPPAWMIILLIAIIVWSFSAATVPSYYAVVTEIFNFQVRSKLLGCVVSYSWFISSVQLIVFMQLIEVVGMHTMFYFFAGMNVFGAVSALVLLPETKGKKVEEIERILAR